MMKRQLAIAAAFVVLLALFVPVPAHAASPVCGVTYTYEVRGRNNTYDLEQFATHAAQTLADVRGWSLGGSLCFNRVPAGGHFTLWLSRREDVSTFNGACHDSWSCRSGRNVVINEHNYTQGTPNWNAAGMSLDDYQHYVVLHEVGHWLGLPHPHNGCSGPGQPASVMQQQSKGGKSLAGCSFNVWPLAWERQQVARARGLSVLGPVVNGDFVQAMGDTGVWLIERGQRRPFLQYQTLKSRTDPANVRRVSFTNLQAFPKGGVVPDAAKGDTEDGVLLSAEDRPVYVMEDGKKRRIPGPETFEANGWYWSDIRKVSPDHLDELPEGEQIPRHVPPKEEQPNQQPAA